MMATLPSNNKAVNERGSKSDEFQNQDQALERIRECLKGLRFGSINVVVQDGVVVQIDRTEKHRLRKPSSNMNS